MDSIQSAFRQRKIEYQELEGENLSLSQMNEIKYNEISRLKMEMKAARDKNLKLKEHKQLNNQSNHKFLREKNEYEQEILNLSKEIETLKSKNYDDERKIQEYEFEIQRNETFNFQGQKSNKSVNILLFVPLYHLFINKVWKYLLYSLLLYLYLNIWNII